MMLTYSLLNPPSIVAGELASQVAPLAQEWRQQAEITTQQLNVQREENERLRAEIERLKASKKSTYEVTAYTSGYESTQKHVGDAGYGITASGTKATEGRTAACPPSLAFGTHVVIDGLGVRICEDRGSAITAYHLDVYFDSVADALSFGRQSRKVEVK
jgi:3D (Asp-Asp-Asp) domain-containing protein